MGESYIVCNYYHQPGCICGRTIRELQLQVREAEKGLLRIYDEVEGLSIEPGRFTGGSRGHLKITICNILESLGCRPAWDRDPEEEVVKCLCNGGPATGCPVHPNLWKTRICEKCGKQDASVTRACFDTTKGYLCHDCDR